MNILIIGCGMVGSALANTLDARGHDVSVIDKSSEKFDSLSPDFGGFTTTGVPIDVDVLKRAGIETCDALFAVTSQDDMNIMVSELAQKTYHISKIFARITDIKKGDVFENLGVNVICPTKLTVTAACAAIDEHDTGIEVNFENYTVHFSTIDVPEEFISKTPNDIRYEKEEMLFAVMHKKGGFIMYRGQDLTFMEGDKLIFAKKS